MQLMYIHFTTADSSMKLNKWQTVNSADLNALNIWIHVEEGLV